MPESSCCHPESWATAWFLEGARSGCAAGLRRKPGEHRSSSPCAPSLVPADGLNPCLPWAPVSSLRASALPPYPLLTFLSLPLHLRIRGASGSSLVLLELFREAAGEVWRRRGPRGRAKRWHLRSGFVRSAMPRGRVTAAEPPSTPTLAGLSAPCLVAEVEEQIFNEGIGEMESWKAQPSSPLRFAAGQGAVSAVGKLPANGLSLRQGPEHMEEQASAIQQQRQRKLKMWRAVREQRLWRGGQPGPC